LTNVGSPSVVTASSKTKVLQSASAVIMYVNGLVISIVLPVAPSTSHCGVPPLNAMSHAAGATNTKTKIREIPNIL